MNSPRISVYDQLDSILRQVKLLERGQNTVAIPTLVNRILEIFQYASGVWGMYVYELCDNPSREALLGFYRQYVLKPVVV